MIPHIPNVDNSGFVHDGIGRSRLADMKLFKPYEMGQLSITTAVRVDCVVTYVYALRRFCKRSTREGALSVAPHHYYRQLIYSTCVDWTCILYLRVVGPMEVNSYRSH